jgi:orotidine-5'-phosphate decarboxylase
MKESKDKKGMNRRDFITMTAAAGFVAVAGKAMAQMPTLVAANPLLGAYDMHVHAAPDTASRTVNDIELAQKAKEMGMKGFVIKNHEFITNDRAYLVRQVVPGVEVFGGITLNASVGGINPSAVDMMLKFTGNCGKIVWLPTHDAAHHKSFFAKIPDAGGIRVIDSAGNVVPTLRTILKSCAKADVIFATGHVSPQEVLASVKAAKEEGVKKILVTHALQSPGELSLDDIKRCVDIGAYIEHVYLANLMGPKAHLAWMQGWRHVSMEMYAQTIKAIGADRCILSSDLGQYLNPTPTDGMKEFILALNKLGISNADVGKMVKENPAKLLGV